MPVNSFDDYPMSWIPVIDKKKRPIYMEIANKLESDIRSGQIKPGTKLPPQRELADFLDVNLSTISKALSVCMSKGIISSCVGSGTYVCYDALVENVVPQINTDVIDMGSALPVASGYEEIADAIKSMANESGFDEWLGYADKIGVAWHKDTAVRIIAKTGYNVKPESIRFSAGGQNAIAAILSGLFRAGDRIGTDPFTYPGLKTAAKLFGIKLIPVAGRSGFMDYESIRLAYRTEGISGLYVMPGYQSPISDMMPPELRKEIARAAKEMNLIVIEDAVHNLLMPGHRSTVAQYAPEQTIFFVSISKAIAPGLRFAAISCPERYASNIDEALYGLNVSISPFMEELSCRLLVSDRADRIIKKHRTSMIVRNEIVNRIVGPYVFGGDDNSFFRWLRLPPNVDERNFERMAYRRGVSVYASERFAVGNTKPFGAVRIALGAPHDLRELEDGLKIIKNLLIRLS